MSGIFAIVDCAADPRLHGWVAAASEHACLFAGEIEPPLDEAAPYLARFDGELAQRWNTDGRGKPWGIIVRSHLPLSDLRRHLRKFLQAQLPDGRVVLFRFYDPRVWSAYWPALSEAEKEDWRSGAVEFMGFEPAR